MAEMKFYIIGPEAAGLKAWADDSGKDKPVGIYGLPDDTPPGSIVICEGRWKFNRGEGYSFLAQSHDIIKRGIGGSITIKCLISRMLYACGAGINGIWVTRGHVIQGDQQNVDCRNQSPLILTSNQMTRRPEGPWNVC